MRHQQAGRSPATGRGGSSSRERGRQRPAGLKKAQQEGAGMSQLQGGEGHWSWAVAADGECGLKRGVCWIGCDVLGMAQWRQRGGRSERSSAAVSSG